MTSSSTDPQRAEPTMIVRRRTRPDAPRLVGRTRLVWAGLFALGATATVAALLVTRGLLESETERAGAAGVVEVALVHEASGVEEPQASNAALDDAEQAAAPPADAPAAAESPAEAPPSRAEPAERGPRARAASTTTTKRRRTPPPPPLDGADTLKRHLDYLARHCRERAPSCAGAVLAEQPRVALMSSEEITRLHARARACVAACRAE